jgi:hypothetical protein
MKLVFTRNELVTMVKTTMSMPGLMKKFLTDDYIINNFEEKMLDLTKKTNAIVYSKVNDEYTIEVNEMFTLELINEFGSLINAVITLTIGVGARMKMIADKYKVKEDDLSEKPKSDVGIDSHTSKNNMYTIHKNSFDVKQELLKLGISNDLNVDSINSILVGVNNKMDIRLYDSCEIDIPVDDDLVLEALIICGHDSLGAVVRNLKTDNRYIREFYFENGNIHVIKSDDGLFTIYSTEGVYIDHIDNQMDKRYYLFFTNIDKVKEFCENNDFNIRETKPKEKIINFHDLDISLASHTILVKDAIIPVDDYTKYRTGLIRGTTQIDGLIFHNGKIYEIRPVPHLNTKNIYLVTKDVYTKVGIMNMVVDDSITNAVISNYEISIDGVDTSSDMWILFFNKLDDMHLFTNDNIGV